MKILGLVDAFCEQLKSPILEDNLAEQVIKNLAYLARILKTNAFNKTDEIIQESVPLKHDLNLMWLLKKVIKESNYELVHNNKQTKKRTIVFKLLAVIALDLGKDDVKAYLNVILPPLQREVVVSESGKNPFIHGQLSIQTIC